MKHGTDFDLGESFTTAGGHVWHVEMSDATPEQAGVPAELQDAAADGCQVLFDGMIYEDGKLFVRGS